MSPKRMTLDQFHKAAEEAGVLAEAIPSSAGTNGKFAGYKITIVGEGGSSELRVYGRHNTAFIDAGVATAAIKAAKEAPVRTQDTDQAVTGQPKSETLDA